MHELSLATDLIREVEAAAAQHGATGVEVVVLRDGARRSFLVTLRKRPD